MFHKGTHKIKGMVLCAGLGTRMKSVTTWTPKPLVPIFGVPILYLILQKFVSLGLKEIAVNAHHLWENLQAGIKSNPFGLDIYFSHETPKILGTAGAYKPIDHWRQNSDLLVMNCDILCDLRLSDLVKTHYEQSSEVATLVLLDPPEKNKTFVWAIDGYIVSIGERPTDKQAKPYTFSGIQLLSHSFLSQLALDQKPEEIIPIYKKILLNKGKIKAHIHRGFWFDMGSIEDYFLAHKNILQSKDRARIFEQLGIDSCHKLLQIKPLIALADETKRLGEGQLVGPSFLTHPCKLSLGSQIGPLALLFLDSPSTATLDIHVQDSIVLGKTYQDGIPIKNQVVGESFSETISQT